MAWWMVAGLRVLLVVGLVVVVLTSRSASHTGTADLDPLLMVGIPLAGAGAALATTVGAAGYGLLAVGITLLGVGARRSRQRPG